MMKRRHLITLPAVVAGAAFATERPNILLILTDDQGYYDMGCYGATDFQTPNLDRMAASGVRFADGYVTAPQCGPSRAGLLTGVQQSRFGYLDNNSQRGLPSSDVVQLLPEQLQALGYRTGLIGKWHIATDNRQPEHPIRPGNHPWERGFEYVLKHNSGHAHYFPYRPDGRKWMTDRNLRPELLLKRDADSATERVENLPPETYLTDYFSEQAAEFVHRHRDRPWFLFLSYNAPHTPMVAREDKMEEVSHIENRTRRQLAAMMLSVDEGVGLILDALERTGQTNRTLIWYLSDNGGPTHQNASRNDPFSGKKGDLHEGGIRVPFLASWPGTIPAGQVLSDPVISLDILPTSLAAAGAGEISEIHDGNDLLPWLKGQADCPNEEIFWSWRQKAAIRAGNLKETRNGNEVQAVDGTTVPGHVFVDLRENPRELGEKQIQSPERRQMLSRRLDDWLRGVEQDRKTLTPP